jgi:threonine dehydratase
VSDGEVSCSFSGKIRVVLQLFVYSLLLGGCAAFEEMGSKTAVIGCQAADVATTEYALHRGAADSVG